MCTFNINRKNIISKAIHDCFVEMYAKAQPAADYDNLVAEYKSGKIKPDERVFERHYLSQEEYDYILNKYLESYRLNKEWEDNVSVVESYLTNGGLKDIYVPDRVDEDGFNHPGYRDAEKVPPIKDQIKEVIYRHYGAKQASDEIANEISNLVISNIQNCKDFYKFDREEDKFKVAVALGPSPTSNAETVKKWWKENYNKDIDIEERNPRLFWYRDNGYTDEDLVEEFESENWKEIVDKEWEEEKEAKKRERKEALKMLEDQHKEFKANHGQKE